MEEGEARINMKRTGLPYTSLPEKRRRKPRYDVTIKLRVSCWAKDACITSDLLEDAIGQMLDSDNAKLIGPVSVDMDEVKE